MRPGPPIHHRHKKIIIAGIVVTIAVLTVVIIKTRANSDAEDAGHQKSVLVEGLNGVKVEPGIAQQRPIAVIIENHPDARPQAGLSQADIVYETLAEGGITRYLALFQTQAAENIGPVRSVRIYLADIANDWHALLAHVGGNSIALSRIKSGTYKNLDDADQYFNDKYFRRVSSRPAPHNVYTSIDKLIQLMVARSYSLPADYESWKFKDDSPLTPPAAATIAIPFSTPGFTASYRYDAATNSYLRSLASKADRDANNQQQLSAKNIIIQYVEETPLPSDAIGTISLKLSGSGEARVFLDGFTIPATWKRENGFTRYYNIDGNEILLNRGQTWVEIVPTTLQDEVKFFRAVVSSRPHLSLL